MARPMAITRTIRKEPVYIGFFKFFIKKDNKHIDLLIILLYNINIGTQKSLCEG